MKNQIIILCSIFLISISATAQEKAVPASSQAKTQPPKKEVKASDPIWLVGKPGNWRRGDLGVGLALGQAIKKKKQK